MSFDERVYNFQDEFIQEPCNGAEATIKENIKSYDKAHKSA